MLYLKIIFILFGVFISTFAENDTTIYIYGNSNHEHQDDEYYYAVEIVGIFFFFILIFGCIFAAYRLDNEQHNYTI